MSNCHLSDVDWVIENSDKIYLVKYKNAEVLPFKLQKNIGNGNKLIEKVSVLSIDEWKEDENYGRFPVKSV